MKRGYAVRSIAAIDTSEPTARAAAGRQGTPRAQLRGRGLPAPRSVLLADMPVDRSPADAKCSTNLGKRVLARVVHLAGECEFRWRHTRRSAASPSSGSRRSQACQSALANEVALKLGQRAEDVEDQLAARRRGVDILLQAAEADVATLELGNRVDQMPQPNVPADPVSRLRACHLVATGREP